MTSLSEASGHEAASCIIIRSASSDDNAAFTHFDFCANRNWTGFTSDVSAAN
ncbi:hypothetical protein D3C71_1838130 [compost metagenome]